MGNDLGQGYKIAAHAMGGDPCWIGMKDLRDGTVEITGFAINAKMGALALAKGASDADQITWVGWKMILHLDDMDPSDFKGRTASSRPAATASGPCCCSGCST